jgi:hypothetical protein
MKLPWMKSGKDSKTQQQQFHSRQHTLGINKLNETAMDEEWEGLKSAAAAVSFSSTHIGNQRAE